MTHQKTTKYCLKIRGLTNNNFICKKCDKNLTSARLLHNHESKCGVIIKKKTLTFDEFFSFYKQRAYKEKQIPLVFTNLCNKYLFVHF